MSVDFKASAFGFRFRFSTESEIENLHLSKKYIRFYNEAKIFLNDSYDEKQDRIFNETKEKINQAQNLRIFKDYLRRFAYGLDASCYRYIPKLVIWAKSEKEIQKILYLAQKYDTPVTFRAAGTSLSGQACSDSILVVCNENFKNIEIIGKNADSIKLDCGVIGSDANAALKKYGKKIGPDPATINNALIGGIFSNNSSGMCCGVKQNSYQTIKSIRVILSDGYILDTSKDIESFKKSHAHIVEALLQLHDEIKKDSKLSEFIKHKFKIKNTTGYAINALVDFSDIKDILNHIFIGAEGTLGFVSKVEYECVQDFNYKACALLFYENLSIASNAIKILAKNEDIVSAAEIMDYASLDCVKNLKGMPDSIHKINKGNCAILVQMESDNLQSLNTNIESIKTQLDSIPTLFGNTFSFDSKTQESWWKIRKGILPLAAATRPSGSIVITEDVCFEIEHFTQGIEGIMRLFEKYNFKGIIFGHALSGNVHFIITPLLSVESEKIRFGEFMDALVQLVVSFEGSIKAEHGTGRMMAPFVEIEWGQKAYEINKKIKAIFDSKNLINTDVIITQDKQIHIKNLKPANANQIEDYLDACMECGFCEKICPSRNITLTPRQRIAVYREIARLESKKDSKNSLELKALKKGYKYFGIETCATCSMCASLCPLEIDTAKIAINLSQKHNVLDSMIVKSFGRNINTTTKIAKASVKIANITQNILGTKNAKNLTNFLHKKINTPLLLESFPTPNNYKLETKIVSNVNGGLKNGEVIYFSSCLNRMFAPSKNAPDNTSIAQVFESLCSKARFNVIYPKNIQSLCCSKAYKNYKNIAKDLAAKTYEALKLESDNGKIPIVCDHSACSLEILKSLKSFKSCLKFYDLSAFVLKYLVEHLELKPLDSKNNNVAIYAPCSTRNLILRNEEISWEDSIFKLARLCGVNILHDSNTKCCGFAGNKGFFTPELNTSALKHFGENNVCESTTNIPRNSNPCKVSQNIESNFKDSSRNIFNKCIQGFSSSSTCEIGLSDKTNFPWQHIIYLVESCSK